MTNGTTRQWLPSRVDWWWMGLIVLWGLARLAPHLAHDSIWPFDESFHQVVTRHTFDHPFRPMLIPDPVHDSIDNYWAARVWLVKPPGAFWIGAFWMLIVGKVPLAFRMGGLLSQLLSALALYTFARLLTKRGWAVLVSLAFLSLPIGWTYTQGRFIGDELDLMLCALLCAAMISLFLSIERDSLAWAALSGVFTGAGVLVKLVLALTPIGVAGVLWLLSRARFCPGPRFRSLLLMTACAFAVGAPWNFYAAHRWHDAYIAANADMLVHVMPKVAAAKAPQWQRPVDAIFNEVNHTLFEPTPLALTLLVGVWLALRALRQRDPLSIGLALWLWATWLGHSLVPIKIHSHLWNVVIPGFVGVAMVLEDVWRSLPLAFGVIAGCMTSWLLPRLPALVQLRERLPVQLGESRRSELLPALIILAVGISVGWGAHFLLRRREPVPAWIVGAIAAVWLVAIQIGGGVSEQKQLYEEARAHFVTSYSKEVGKTIDAVTPAQSVVMLDRDFDARDQIEDHNLMFWSDRLVFIGRDPRDYPQAGFHPYLVSPNAEPFEPLPVPASAWLRAYDLTRPRSGPTPLPEGLHPLDVQVGALRVLGFASSRADGDSDRYAFIVQALNGRVNGLPVSFKTGEHVQNELIPPEASLRSRWKLLRTDWFVLPAIGPHLADVHELVFGPAPGQRIVLN